MTDTEYMKIAIEYAKKGSGSVNPNPMVGAVIVKHDQIVGEGYHKKRGEPHAERYALMNCRESAAGATLYVTLEPCCHYGKTPPCTEAIIESGISRVVVGSVDPNPLVAGKGIEILRKQGIEVISGILQDECDRLNEVFFHFIQTKRPFVVMKYAMTMDGKIATRTGASKWITGEAARGRVQQDRHRYTAIMTGSGTVLADDPLLTCRMEGGKNPIRIICDTNLKVSPTHQIIKTAKEVLTIIATACTDAEKQQPLKEAGCEILVLQRKEGHLDLEQLMEELGKRNIDSILLEGGGRLNWSMIQCGVVDKVQCYIAAKLFGGDTAPSPIAGMGVELPEAAVQLTDMTFSQIGEDFLFEGRVK